MAGRRSSPRTVTLVALSPRESQELRATGQPTDPAERVGRQRAALPVRVDDLADVVGPGRHHAPFGRHWIGVAGLLARRRAARSRRLFLESRWIPVTARHGHTPPRSGCRPLRGPAGVDGGHPARPAALGGGPAGRTSASRTRRPGAAWA